MAASIVRHPISVVIGNALIPDLLPRRVDVVVAAFVEFKSQSPAATEALGESWGHDAVSGLVIGLSGDLGAGKTQLVKGIARGLDILARVHSPTFTLVNVYEGGRLKLFHLDLYRLESAEQALDAGLEDYLTPDGVTVIEWAERLFPAGHESQSVAARLPQRYRRVNIETLSETQRRIFYEDSGA
jgi:tRNA threonylcarbamoyladenosine biosynthesis protein TsaE